MSNKKKLFSTETNLGVEYKRNERYGSRRKSNIEK